MNKSCGGVFALLLTGIDRNTIDIKFWKRRGYQLQGGDVIMRSGC